MPPVHVSVSVPDELWQALATQEGDANTVVLRALEEYVAATAIRRGHRSGKYQKLVTALSRPVADLDLSARPATALHLMGIRYVYELVALEPHALRMRHNFGEKSLREVKAKLLTLGLTWGMTLEDESYRAAVVTAVAAHIEATRG